MKTRISLAPVALTLGSIGFLSIIAIFSIPAVRRRLISSRILEYVRDHKLLPKISETERTALEAGGVWIEKEFFLGRPDLKWISSRPYLNLNADEQAFLNGPVERLCQMVHDWTIWKRRDLPETAWEFIKKERFWGMIIPKEYGGLGFSALAHSEVIMKLASRSIPLSITVMVPNSLGPAELLIRYGTEAQKKYYLPRLARGEEIPCFALTEPGAGSDAASIEASGIVFRDSNHSLRLRLNWNKRWTTLAAVSTLIGVAFRLRDPENLLGKGEDVGITCALVPTRTHGVIVNRRHDPLRVPFYNSPTHGENVIVSIEAIIGGIAQAGQGWKMLMECLAAGRGISLPAQSTGEAKYVTRVTSAGAVVRKQFSTSIGNFEGVAEVLARIAGFTYILESARRFTCGAMDSGVQSSIISAIVKYHSTELSRKIINDGMDIAGGAGITLGPRNLLAHGYIAAPIGITVEGANILSRSLIVFGQGVIRAHPYLYTEFTSARSNDLRAFDRALWGHAAALVQNGTRSFFHSLTRGHFVNAPTRGKTKRYWQKLGWMSASFAWFADLYVLTLGKRFKKSEAVSERFADILSWMYLISSVLRRFEAEGSLEEDFPLVHWGVNYGFRQIQKAFEGLLTNNRTPVLRVLLRNVVFPYSSLNRVDQPVSDRFVLKVAKLIQIPGSQRDRLTTGIFLPSDPADPFYRLELAFRLVHAKHPDAEKLRDEAIQVDDFSFEEYFGRREDHAGAA